MSGKVRQLVPFFVPDAEGDVVNEALHQFSNHSQSHSSPIKLNVRQWDDKEGFFRDAVQVIHDREHSPSAISSLPHLLTHPPATAATTTPRLLTPAEIRLSRRRASRHSTPTISHERASVDPSARSATSSPASKKHASSTTYVTPPKPPKKTPSPSRKSVSSLHSLHPSPGSGNSNSTSTTPAKGKLFAGSTFEAASPAPVTLPIPAFVRNSSSPQQPRAHPLTTEAAMREQAAVDLRRILRI